jgi:hypothetical protein
VKGPDYRSGLWTVVPISKALQRVSNETEGIFKVESPKTRRRVKEPLA